MGEQVQCHLHHIHTVSPPLQPSTTKPNLSLNSASHTNISNDMVTSDDGVGEMPALIKTQISLSSSFERWLAQKIESDADRSGVIAKVLCRVDSYKKWLEAAEKSPHQELEAPDSWVMEANRRMRDGSSPVITITGPGSGETLEIITKDDIEADNLMGVCRTQRLRESWVRTNG